MTHILYKNKEKITQWLQKYNIQNYELIEDKEYGYIVNVNSNVDLCHNKLKQIKVKFNIINGSFYCYNNKLTSLKGCPEIIKGDFYCNSNKINSLEYFPKKIKLKCHLENNTELGEIQNINDFQELKKIHESIVLKKKLHNKLEKEISIDNNIKNAKIKL